MSVNFSLILKRVDSGIEIGSTWALLFSLFLMLVLSLLIIIFRLLGHSYLWMDPLVRHLVLFATFLGGVLSTGRGTHIAIDVLSKVLEANGFWRILKRHKQILLVTSFLGTLVLCAATSLYLLVEYQMHESSFLGVPSYLLFAIIPFGFFIISIRFFLQLAISLMGPKHD